MSKAKDVRLKKPDTFQTKYQEIQFGRIKQKDKLKYCPLESLVLYIDNDPKVNKNASYGLGNYLPWTPAKASALFNQKVSQQSQIQLQDAQHQSHAGAISSSDPSSLSSAAKAIPSSWSALLKSSQTGSSDAAHTSNPSPFISKTKKNQTNINNRNQTSHIEKWRIVNTSQKGPPIVPRGLINNGNTCFMNSILQPLLHTPPFYLFLMGLYQRGGIFPTPNVKTRVLDSMMTFVKEFRNSSEQADPIQDCAFSCEYVYDAIRHSTAKDSLKGRQEDAQEFLGFILDGIHEELLETIDKPRLEPENGVEWTQVGKKNKQISTQSTEINHTQMSRIFGGVWKSTLRTGNKESVTTEPFQIVALDIAHESIHTLQDALRAACTPEVLSDFNSPNQTTKQLQFEKLPPVLVISIKRFIFDEVRGALKSGKHIEIPSKLEIPSESLSRNAHLDFNSTHAYTSSSSSSNEEDSEGKLSSKVYHLYAVVQHHGKFSEGGHYTSDILHQSDQWYRFDDSSVTTIDEKLVTGEQKDRQPYILFYIEKN